MEPRYHLFSLIENAGVTEISQGQGLGELALLVFGLSVRELLIFAAIIGRFM